MREVKIRFIAFSVFQFIFEVFDWGREVYDFMDLKRWTGELKQILCLSFARLNKLVLKKTKWVLAIISHITNTFTGAVFILTTLVRSPIMILYNK